MHRRAGPLERVAARDSGGSAAGAPVPAARARAAAATVNVGSPRCTAIRARERAWNACPRRTVWRQTQPATRQRTAACRALYRAIARQDKSVRSRHTSAKRRALKIKTAVPLAQPATPAAELAENATPTTIATARPAPRPIGNAKPRSTFASSASETRNAASQPRSVIFPRDSAWHVSIRETARRPARSACQRRTSVRLLLRKLACCALRRGTLGR